MFLSVKPNDLHQSALEALRWTHTEMYGEMGNSLFLHSISNCQPISTDPRPSQRCDDGAQQRLREACEALWAPRMEYTLQKCNLTGKGRAAEPAPKGWYFVLRLFLIAWGDVLELPFYSTTEVWKPLKAGLIPPSISMFYFSKAYDEFDLILHADNFDLTRL